MTSLGVIIGRFQVAELHAGHKHLISHAEEKSGVVMILLGTSEAVPSTKNPLSFVARKRMVLESFPNVLVYEIKDHPSNEVWSQSVDKTIELSFPTAEVTLYGSRDSFMSYYSGKHPVTVIPEIPNISGTLMRKIGEKPVHEKSFRLGMIEAQNNRYPTSFQTVDIGVVNYAERKILLGRKTSDPKGLWRLPGGFVDPNDESLESAAQRELREEAGNFLTDAVVYLGSYRAHDYRYRSEADKVMTALFLTYYMGGQVKAGDDLEEVRWFAIDDALMHTLPEHKPLVERIIRKVEEV